MTTVQQTKLSAAREILHADVEEFLQSGGRITECPPFEFRPFREAVRKPLPDDERFKRNPATMRKPRQTRGESDNACPPLCLKSSQAFEYCRDRGYRKNIEQWRYLIKTGKGPAVAKAHVGKAGKVFYYFTESALDAWLCPMGEQS